MAGESREQFPLTCAALSTCAGAERDFLSIRVAGRQVYELGSQPVYQYCGEHALLRYLPAGRPARWLRTARRRESALVRAV